MTPEMTFQKMMDNRYIWFNIGNIRVELKPTVDKDKFWHTISLMDHYGNMMTIMAEEKISERVVKSFISQFMDLGIQGII
jgi:S-adenosylmethionine hydrolase